MHATQANDGSIETAQATLLDSNEPDLEAFLTHISRLTGVEADPRPEAHVCGAVGCRLEEYLAQVRIDGFGKRVLCPIHVTDLVEREVGHV